MNVPSDPPRFFRLHHCAAHGHYHVLYLPSDIASLPSCSLTSLVSDVWFARHQIAHRLPPAKQDLAERELDRIAEEVNALARMQRRERGKFARGFLIPREAPPYETSLRQGWSMFTSGTVLYAAFASEELHGTMSLPIGCDFIVRAEPPTKGRSLSRAEWARLAEAPARRVRPSEVALAVPA